MTEELTERQAQTDFERDGFVIIPPIFNRQQIDRVIEHMDRVIAGDYVNPKGGHVFPAWKPGDSPTMIRKIDQAHVVDPVIYDLISSPSLGEWAAAITGANFVQVWATQCLYKPAGGDEKGNIGWHQDFQYWNPWWTPDSVLFTAWIAISDVEEESGPMRFVRGSNHWGFLNQGNFFGTKLEELKSGISIPKGQKWEEVSAIMPAGAVSFHHRHTIHGSGPNLSNKPRRSFAIHLRTENSAPNTDKPPHYYNQNLNDPVICPAIYRS